MDSFYSDNDVVIDPAYGSYRAYAVDFDYDLLGKPLHFNKWFWGNHLLYVRKFFEENPLLITCIIFLGVFLLLILLSLLLKCLILPQKVLQSFYIDREMKEEQKQWAERKKFMQAEDHDRYAAVHCRAAANKFGVANLRYPTPRDLVDYEAIRFVFQQPWLVDKTHKALMKTDFHPIFDQFVEGELEDALMLALKEKRMFKRKPLSLPARLAAKQLLAKGEAKLPTGPVITPEMRLIQGWEELYRQRLREATEENYRWWLAQDRTLPVEAKEVKEKLQPIVTEVRKKRRALSPEDHERLLDFDRLPHQEPAQIISQRKGANKSPEQTETSVTQLVGGAQFVDQQQDLDESKMLRELEEAEQAQVAKIKRATRHKSGSRKSKRKDKQPGKKED